MANLVLFHFQWLWWGGGPGSKNQSYPEWPETYFGFAIFEI